MPTRPRNATSRGLIDVVRIDPAQRTIDEVPLAAREVGGRAVLFHTGGTGTGARRRTSRVIPT
jgi:hypothetical protein